MVDYSKWDKMNFDDSDEESNEDESSSTPRVTRLDRPGSVTLTKDGCVSIGDTALDVANETNVENGSDNSQDMYARRTALPSQSRPPRYNDSQDTSLLRRLAYNGGCHMDGVVPVFWGQDRRQVTISVPFDPSLQRTKNIAVNLIGSYAYVDRNSAVGNTKKVGALLTVSCKGATLLSGSTPHPVHLAENEDDVDWDIEEVNADGNGTNDKSTIKFVRIHLNKACPMEGVTIWWSRPLLQFAEINVESIAGRNRCNGKMKEGNSEINRGEKLKKTWDEAHELFKTKIQNREKLSINLE